MRITLFVIGIVLLAVALVVAAAGGPIPFVVWSGLLGLILTAGIAFERGRYTANSARRPGADWVATDERFLDPASGETVTVFYQPVTGERRYVHG
jgi:hypothetical protein